MTRFTDAALLKGEFAEMLKHPPKESEWKNTSCENSAEAVSQEIAKHIFSMQSSIDPEKSRLEVFSYSAKGSMKVVRILPGEADLIRIDGILLPSNGQVSVVQHASLLSLTFCIEDIEPDGPEAEEDGGTRIGFVIFDELSRRKKSRDAARKKSGKVRSSKRKAVGK